MLLARMADAVYWGGRYLERAEGIARVVQVHTDAHVDLPVGRDVGWEPLLAISGLDDAVPSRHGMAAGDRNSMGRSQGSGPRRTTSSDPFFSMPPIPPLSFPP